MVLWREIVGPLAHLVYWGRSFFFESRGRSPPFLAIRRSDWSLFPPERFCSVARSFLQESFVRWEGPPDRTFGCYQGPSLIEISGGLSFDKKCYQILIKYLCFFLVR